MGTINAIKQSFDEWLGGLFENSVRRLIQENRVAPEVGASRTSSDKPRDGEEFVASVDKLMSGQRHERGHQSSDGIESHGDGYRDRLFRFLEVSEGNRLKTYKDHKGNRTVGVGFNLDAKGARQRFEEALPEADFTAVRDGRKKLTAAQSRRLFDSTIGYYEGFVKNKFKDTPLAEHQFIALTSMAYNSPALLGPNLTRAVKTGDTDSAVYEIARRSNKGRSKGIQNRRDREAQMFLGPAADDYNTTVMTMAQETTEEVT